MIIGSLYEIEREIGSGGGGVVYLGRHLRLDKEVVLKADKRPSTAKADSLSREMKALRNLSHSCIPQVYDYFEEDGVVYTVIDYVPGESFDKILKRGQRFEQVKIIKWLDELLQALSYLHTRPPHGILHSDIKPANIMLTTENSVKLIDFNIALALSEEGAATVGISYGYSSPEHYGIDVSIDPTKTAIDTSSKSNESMTVLDTSTVLDRSHSDTVVDFTEFNVSPTPYAKGKKKFSLDVRSDIYSLGATVYHFMTGKRPATKAQEVAPLGYDCGYSRGLVDIINKAMKLNPAERFGTAEEMLTALRSLRKTDDRVLKIKKQQKINYAAVAATFVIGAALSIAGMGQNKRVEEAYRLAQDSVVAYESGDIETARRLALDSLEVKTPEGQYALTNALGVYDINDSFKPYDFVELSSKILYTKLSPSGEITAAIAKGTLTLINNKSGQIICEEKILDSALSEVVFINEYTIAYAGEKGLTICNYIDNDSRVIGDKATKIAISGDKKTLAAIYKDESTCNIYDIGSGEKIRALSLMGKVQNVPANDVLANPNNNLLELDEKGELLAVSFKSGEICIFEVYTDQYVQVLDKSSYVKFSGGFYKNFFAFSATGIKSYAAVLDLKTLYFNIEFQSSNPMTMKVIEDEIFLSHESVVVKINPVTGAQSEVMYTDSEIKNFDVSKSYAVALTKVGKFNFYDRKKNLLSKIPATGTEIEISDLYAAVTSGNSSIVNILKYDDKMGEKAFLTEDIYPHDETRVTSDKKRYIMFSGESFRIFDMSGMFVASKNLDDAVNVHNTEFMRDDELGDFLKVTYLNGVVKMYSGQNGKLIVEDKTEPPDKSLYEEFFVGDYRIESPLHEPPAVFSIKTNKFIKNLEANAYLTYVTEIDAHNKSYILTEYISLEGERYGILLNDKLERVARLSNLCDYFDGEFYFDYNNGKIKKTVIYEIDNLINMAKNINNEETK